MWARVSQRGRWGWGRFQLNNLTSTPNRFLDRRLNLSLSPPNQAASFALKLALYFYFSLFTLHSYCCLLSFPLFSFFFFKNFAPFCYHNWRCRKIQKAKLLHIIAKILNHIIVLSILELNTYILRFFNTSTRHLINIKYVLPKVCKFGFSFDSYSLVVKSVV